MKKPKIMTSSSGSMVPSGPMSVRWAGSAAGWMGIVRAERPPRIRRWVPDCPRAPAIGEQRCGASGS